MVEWGVRGRDCERIEGGRVRETVKGRGAGGSKGGREDEREEGRVRGRIGARGKRY